VRDDLGGGNLLRGAGEVLPLRQVRDDWGGGKPCQGRGPDLSGVSGETATRLPDPMALYLWENRPVGEGLAGMGEAETAPPSPVSTSRRDTVLTSGNTPAARPLRGLLPPPPEGAGSKWR
jgi:hypothetical protein